MRSKLQLSAGAVAALLCACEDSPQVSPPRLESFEHCRAVAGEPVNRLALFSARLGTVWLGDAGCEWIGATSDGGALIATHHKIFGTRGTLAPDVRVIAEKTTSMAEAVEWHDDDGDGRRDMEKWVRFGPEGEEERVEQIDWNDAGLPEARSVVTSLSDGAHHVVTQRFIDGGWATTREYDEPYRCEYRPINPITPVGPQK